MNMDFFKGGNLQFNNMNDFMNQINKKGNELNIDEGIDDPEFDELMKDDPDWKKKKR